MNGRSFANFLNTHGTDLGPRWIVNRLRGLSDTMGAPHWRFRGRRPRRHRTSAQRGRASAFVTERLEVRSVPSGLTGVSLSALTSTLPPAVHSSGLFTYDVVTPGTSSDGPGAELAPGSTTLYISNVAGDVAGLLGDVLGARGSGPAVAPGGSQSGGAEIGISIGASLELTGTGISTSASVSNQRFVSTVSGVSGDVKLTPSPLDPPGESPILSPPSVPTLPPAPGAPGGSPIGSEPPLPPSAGTSSDNPTAPSNPSAPAAGGPAQFGGKAAAAQPVVFVPNGGPAASLSVLGDATNREAVSSTTGPPISATVPGPANDGAAGSQGLVEDGPSAESSSSVESRLPTASELTRAELLPGDLESLERALAQLLRRFDRIDKDLTGLFTELGTNETLIVAGMLVLAGEVLRRWERRQRLVLPRAQSGFSGRPGPFYRPRACPFGRPGAGQMARSAIL